MRCLRRPPLLSAAPDAAGLAAPSFTAPDPDPDPAPDPAAADAAAAAVKLALPAAAVAGSDESAAIFATAIVFPLPSPLSLRFEKWLSSFDAFAKRVLCILCKSGKLFVIFTTV